MYKLFKKVIVGIDEGNHAPAILNAAIKIAKEAKAKVIIVSAMPFALDTSYSYNTIEGGMLSSYIGPDPQEIEQAVQIRKEMIEALVAKTIVPGAVEVDIIVSLEDPKDLIMNTASKYESPLIVLGATSKKSLERFLVGSVTQYIVNNAPADVLIIK